MKYLLFILLAIIFSSCTDSNPVAPTTQKATMNKPVYDKPPKKVKYIYIPPPALKVKHPGF